MTKHASALFSSRSARDLGLNPLAAALASARAAGRPLIDLTASNPTALGLPYPDDLLRPLAHRRGLRYRPHPLGLRAAREAVAAEWRARGVPIDRGQVVLTASSSESYGFLFKLLCDPGDSVLIPRPSYPLFDLLAELDAVRLRPYRLAFDGRWFLDRASLRAAVGARTRAVVTVHPNNPTGSYLSRGELSALAALEVPIISDEVFSAYPLGARGPGPGRAETALEAGDRALVFALGGLSKFACLPQLKLGWIVVEGPAPLRDEALARLELIGDSYLSAATPVQEALPELLSAAAPVREALVSRARRNLAHLERAIAARPLLDLRAPEGGWYAVVRVPRVMEDLAWARALVEGPGVVTHPGSFFGIDEGAHLVISLIPRPADFDAGIAALGALVARASGAEESPPFIG